MTVHQHLPMSFRNTSMNVQTLKREVETELANILDYWMKYTPDEANGGFVGKIDHDNKVYTDAPKGAVLNARILWSFSAAYYATQQPRYLQIAGRAFNYIQQYFVDPEYGGVYWTVDVKGGPLNTKKQVYAQAFVIYACSEYYRCSGHPAAKNLAIEFYHLLQAHSYDEQRGGYLEAFTREWQPIEDARLSAKDANEAKTMNTHLHVLEAYTTLYHIWPDEVLSQHIQKLLDNFYNYIINRNSWHLNLFFTENWDVKADTISYGHDIEGSWLLLEAAEVLHDEELIKTFQEIALHMTNATLEGLDVDGGLWYEYEPAHQHLIKEKHSWPQAEAMIGFVNAWQISGDENYLQQAFTSWLFIKEHMIDKQHGEWYWGVKENYEVMNHEDKVGIWKCPYHNSRACLELMRRLTLIPSPSRRGMPP